MAEIITNIWLGTSKISKNEEFLKNKNIKFMINCDNDFNYINMNNNEVNAKLIYYWKKVTSEIYKKIIDYDSVLIFSNDFEKMYSIILAYFIIYGNTTLTSAITIIQNKIDSRYFPNYFISKNLKYLENNI